MVQVVSWRACGAQRKRRMAAIGEFSVDIPYVLCPLMFVGADAYISRTLHSIRSVASSASILPFNG